MATLEEYRNPVFVKACDVELESFVAANSGVNTILITTPDGFTISSAVKDENKHNMDNLAAVGSTIFALGASASEQLELGVCNSVTIENQQGRIYICAIEGGKDKSLVLFLETTQKAMLATILHASRRLVEAITKKMDLIG
ncbi:MAG: roadblock/LC7 domain-containing protein [Cardiobacteriaceae bacterium]|nr:roadblock/LC7 domain-containing protein [Cardiobacteriaceae bacterium]